MTTYIHAYPGRNKVLNQCNFSDPGVYPETPHQINTAYTLTICQVLSSVLQVNFKSTLNVFSRCLNYANQKVQCSLCVEQYAQSSMYPLFQVYAAALGHKCTLTVYLYSKSTLGSDEIRTAILAHHLFIPRRPSL